MNNLIIANVYPLKHNMHENRLIIIYLILIN